jgi:hypothetical protein
MNRVVAKRKEKETRKKTMSGVVAKRKERKEKETRKKKKKR